MKISSYLTILLTAISLATPIPVFSTELNEQATNKLISIFSNKKESLSEEVIQSMVKKPTTQIQLLENIKFAFDHDFLLHADFFTDKNLNHFFGMEKIWIASGDVKPKFFSISTNDFGGLFKPAEFGGTIYPGSQISLGMEYNKIGKLSSFIHFGIPGIAPEPKELHFDDIEKVFGKKWVLLNDVWLHGPPPPATGPHGNQDIKYTLDNASVKRSIVIGFYNDGSLSNIYITEEEK